MDFNKIEIGSYVGLSYSGDHDSAICIISPQGQITYASSLERHTRVKQDGRWPHFFLDEFPWGRIDSVSIATNFSIPAEDALTKSKYFPSSFNSPRHDNIHHVSMFYEKINTIGAKINWVDHQLSHAASACWLSNFDQSIVLTYDGGMYNSPSFGGLFHFDKVSGIQNIDSFSNLYHPKVSTFYTFITGLLGFSPNRHEGKITGLAAHGKSSNSINLILENWFENEFFELEKCLRWYFSHEEEIPATLDVDTYAINRFQNEMESFKRADIAAAIQAFTERHVLTILENYLTEKNINATTQNICLAGGLFSNVKMNQKIANLGFKNIFICPAMTDDGSSLGAALHTFNRQARSKVSLNNFYLGGVYDKASSKNIVDSWPDLMYYMHKDPVTEISRLLADGSEVAIWQGRAEFGPRALGNRSILASASDVEINNTLNKKLHRTEFMPFAPIIRDVHTERSFNSVSNTKLALEFMTITVECKEEFKLRHPGVVHIDGTARPQILNERTNPLIYKVLEQYEQLTGDFALVNTSFNVHEEPIVESPEDAIRGFLQAGLDVLYLEPGIFLKIDQNYKAAFTELKYRKNDIKMKQSERKIRHLELERNVFLRNSLAWKYERDLLVQERDSRKE